eukprot:COSAG02_NODE_3275_length_7029_cov_17.536075_1_plen_138_part_10
MPPSHRDTRRRKRLVTRTRRHSVGGDGPPPSRSRTENPSTGERRRSSFGQVTFTRAVPRLVQSGTVGPRLCSLVIQRYVCMAARPNGRAAHILRTIVYYKSIWGGGGGGGSGLRPFSRCELIYNLQHPRPRNTPGLGP